MVEWRVERSKRRFCQPASSCHCCHASLCQACRSLKAAGRFPMSTMQLRYPPRRPPAGSRGGREVTSLRTRSMRAASGNTAQLVFGSECCCCCAWLHGFWVADRNRLHTSTTTVSQFGPVRFGWACTTPSLRSGPGCGQTAVSSTPVAGA